MAAVAIGLHRNVLKHSLTAVAVGLRRSVLLVVVAVLAVGLGLGRRPS